MIELRSYSYSIKVRIEILSGSSISKVGHRVSGGKNLQVKTVAVICDDSSSNLLHFVSNDEMEDIALYVLSMYQRDIREFESSIETLSLLYEVIIG